MCTQLFPSSESAVGYICTTEALEFVQANTPGVGLVVCRRLTQIEAMEFLFLLKKTATTTGLNGVLSLGPWWYFNHLAMLLWESRVQATALAAQSKDLHPYLGPCSTVCNQL